MRCGCSGVSVEQMRGPPAEALVRGIRSSNSESGLFLRHGHEIFIANLSNLDFDPLICLMPTGNFDLQEIVTQSFSPAIASRLKRDHFQRLPNKTLAESAVLFRRQL